MPQPIDLESAIVLSGARWGKQQHGTFGGSTTCSIYGFKHKYPGTEEFKRPAFAFMKHHGLDSFTYEVGEILMFNKASGIFDVGFEPSSEIRALHCIYFVHLAFLMYNSCRHGSKCTDRLMTSIVKQSIKHSSKAWHMRVGILRNGF